MFNNKFKTFILLSLTFPLTLFLIVSSANFGGGDAAVITVPDDVQSINKAILMAPDGGIVKIKGGTYEEAVYVNKSITLLGENSPILFMPLTVADAKNVTLKGIRFILNPPGTEPAIIAANASNLTLENLIIEASGILLVNSTDTLVKNCNFVGNPGPSISIRGVASRNVVIEWCCFNQTYTALMVRQATDVTFRYNTADTTGSPVKLQSGCQDATIYLNNFLKGEAEDYGANNKWYNQTLKLGNLWGNPNPEKDKNKDGIIDEPKTIGGTAGSRDEYPLAKPFTEYLNGKKPENIWQENTAIIVIAAAITLLATIILTVRRHMLKRRGENKIGLENKPAKHP